jgi:hypothetical protein
VKERRGEMRHVPRTRLQLADDIIRDSPQTYMYARSQPLHLCLHHRHNAGPKLITCGERTLVSPDGYDVEETGTRCPNKRLTSQANCAVLPLIVV